MPLTDRQIRSVKPTDRNQKLSDGGGLFLHVTPQGSKLFRLAYRYQHKQKLLSLGAYPAVTLAEARRMRDEAKACLAQGADPSAERKAAKKAAVSLSENTFGAFANKVIEKAVADGRARTTIEKKRWLFSLIEDDFADLPIAGLSGPVVLSALRQIEARGNYETAKRVRSFVSQACRIAVVEEAADSDPTFGLRDALVTPQVVHRAAIIRPDEFGGLIRAIDGFDGSATTRAALRLMALLYPRPGELRAAVWSEFDLDNGEWVIPAERAKMRRPHRKPLPAEAVDILREQHERHPRAGFVFPAIHTAARCMSENTMNAALRRLGYTKEEATSHGFRASASTLLNESGLWSPDAIEAELGHADRDSVRRAYHRAAYWDERRRMAEWWAVEVARLGSQSRAARQHMSG